MNTESVGDEYWREHADVKKNCFLMFAVTRPVPDWGTVPFEGIEGTVGQEPKGCAELST